MHQRRWMTMLRRGLREGGAALLDLAAHSRCAGCGEIDPQGLCRPCRRQLDAAAQPVCVRCGVPLLPETARWRAGRAWCGDRLRHRRLRSIRAARAPFGYAGTGGALVRRLKFQQDRAAARVLVEAMAGAVEPQLRQELRRALVLPVPLSRRKRRQRGLDQALLLASGVGERLGIEVAGRMLCRTRDTLPQGDPRVTQRDANVAGAFALRRSGRVRDREILLVDDVFTSGATVRACAAVLRRAGCAGVVVLTGCRARH